MGSGGLGTHGRKSCSEGKGLHPHLMTSLRPASNHNNFPQTSSVSHACFEELGAHQKSKTLLLILSQAKQQSIVIVARSW